jgi:DNA-binding beta-propeller fold protein YncE
MSYSRWMILLGLLSCPVSLSAGEKIVLVAGGTEPPAGIAAERTQLKSPFGIDFTRQGVGYIIELAGQRVFKLENGLLHHVAGTGNEGRGGDGGPGVKAEFNGMHNLAIGPDGVVYLADTWNQRVRKYDPKTGTVTNFAGTGDKGFSGDRGPADKATFGGIYCVTLAPDQRRLLVADLDNRRIRSIDLPTGEVTTVAGNGQSGIPSDGAVAVTAPLVDPRAVTADSAGRIYILERSGHALRIVDPDGKIRTVVGTGKRGHTGDGGPGRMALLNGPKHLCLDRDGSVIIADTENHTVRRYLPYEDRIVKVAGSGKKGTAGIGGPPEEVEMFQPHGVTIGPGGELFIVDSGNNRVLKIVKD